MILAVLFAAVVATPLLPERDSSACLEDRLARGRRHPLVPPLGPLSFQPGELAKLRALRLPGASLLARKAEKVRVFSVGFLPPLLVTGVMMGLLLKQPDLGTAVIFGCVALGLLFIAGTRTSYLILAVLVAAPAGWKFIVSTPFRMRRMLAFLDPWAFRRDVGYQITESLISVGSGGVTGLGLGDGRQKLFFLPEAHTDFILSIVGEELGLIGVLFVIGAFAVLVWRGLRAAVRARDVFGAYLAFGITRDVRAAGAGEHRRGAGIAADQGPAAAVHQLRRNVAGDEPLHGRRAGQHLRAQPRAARVAARRAPRRQGRQPPSRRRPAPDRRGGTDRAERPPAARRAPSRLRPSYERRPSRCGS